MSVERQGIAFPYALKILNLGDVKIRLKTNFAYFFLLQHIIGIALSCCLS